MSLGRHGRVAAKEMFHEVDLQSWVFGVIEYAVKICATVVKDWEQKSLVRHLDNPVPDAVFDTIGLTVVAEAGFGKLYWTNAAQQELMTSSEASNIPAPSEDLPGMS